MVSSDKASSSNTALAAMEPLKTSLANARFSTVAQQASEFLAHPENFDLVSAKGSAVENGCAKVLSAVREIVRETLVGGLRKLRVVSPLKLVFLETGQGGCYHCMLKQPLTSCPFLFDMSRVQDGSLLSYSFLRVAQVHSSHQHSVVCCCLHDSIHSKCRRSPLLTGFTLSATDSDPFIRSLCHRNRRTIKSWLARWRTLRQRSGRMLRVMHS